MTSDRGRNGHRDIIVLGASAGGVTAVTECVRGLPTDLNAAVFVVVHVPAGHDSALPQILARASALPAAHAVDHEPIESGRIYVAPPDRHLVLEDGKVRTLRGPRENHNRPAVDPLFRSAARVFGPRVIGVVLSGSLDDGTAGLREIKKRGGMAIVQDPQAAAFADMPASAMGNVEVDYVVSTQELGSLLAKLTSMEAPPMENHERALDAALAGDDDNMGAAGEPGHTDAPGVFSCPDCGGVLTEAQEGELSHFRCRVGHAFSPESLIDSQSGVIEEALWTGVRSMEESADVLSRLATRARKRGQESSVNRYEGRVRELRSSAHLVRAVLEGWHPEGATT